MNKRFKKFEEKVIRKYGGHPLKIFACYDGFVKNKPCLVKPVRKGNTFRIEHKAHLKIIHNEGYYIFCNRNGDTKKCAAKEVSKLLGQGTWYKDGGYKFKFIYASQVF